MPFRFANVAGRSALIADDRFFDLASLSGGSLPADPMAALEHASDLMQLSEGLASATPSGALAGWAWA